VGKEDGYYIRVTFAGGADYGITVPCVEMDALGQKLLDQFGIASISGLDEAPSGRPSRQWASCSYSAIMAAGLGFMTQRNLDFRLLKAAEYGNLQMVQKALAKGADIHAWRDNVLVEAAHRGHLEVVKYLLERDGEKANVHASEDALPRAAVYGYVEIVKYLLEKGADVHADNDLALAGAAYHGLMDIVKVLAKHIFAPKSWRGKSRAEIEVHAAALYDKIKAWDFRDPMKPERLHATASILADCAIDCWHQVRPIPQLIISPTPAQPRPV